MTTEVKAAPRRPAARVRRLIRGAQLELRMLAMLGILSLGLSLISPYFFTLSNILNLMDQSVITGIVSIGQTFVILIAGIDLSVGSLTGATGIVLGLSLQTLPLPLAIAVAIIAGGLAGFVNGYIITKGRVAAFIVTLGMMSVGRSMAYVLSGANSISQLPDALGDLASATVFGIPLNFVVLVVLYAIAWYYLTFTKGGRTIYAIGSNAEAARTAGLRVELYSILVYVISGALSAVAAVFLAARILSIDPIAATGLELDTIAAVVIGGASLFGGRGTIIGTFIGVVIMVLIRNGLNLLNVNPYWQGTAIGSIIVAAVLLERFLSAREGLGRAGSEEG
ncbi:MAG TPA: ABC transporter permease [Stellaceae bacterium]|jgi:ribose transport system permease protein|nr:ABC transporter permease [Stellaceae bacterium]